MLSIAIVLPVGAQQTDTTATRSTHAVPVPSAVAAPKTGGISLDGRLDEEAWTRATPVTDFTQIDPKEGEPATQRTEVRFLYDYESLYVGARL